MIRARKRERKGKSVLQIQQVFLNLCLNAFQAMPQGGVLSIKADPVPSIDEKETFILLSVTDTGKGISPEHLKKDDFDKLGLIKDESWRSDFPGNSDFPGDHIIAGVLAFFLIAG